MRTPRRKLVLRILAAVIIIPLLLYTGLRQYLSRTEQWTPVPPIVAPGKFEERPPPAGALVLFEGSGLGEWRAKDGTAARWTVEGGVLTVAKGTGNIQTARRFMDYELHLEWRIPPNINGSGQMRGNSGLFLASTGPGDEGYELQILDSYRNETYVNGQAGAIYKQHAPLANPLRPPGEWQSYDVVWTAPRFAPDGKLTSPARVTARLNGVLVQDNVALKGETVFIGTPQYRMHGPSPIKLQDHGDPSPAISFRNIWLREIGAGEPPAPTPTP